MKLCCMFRCVAVLAVLFGTVAPVLAGHQHVIGDVLNLQSTLDGKANKYANVIVVAKSGGDFTDPSVAMASIADASASNYYLIKVMPGTYNIAERIYMKNYVDIEGSGKLATRIVGSYMVLVYQNHDVSTEVRDITIHGESSGSCNDGQYGVVIAPPWPYSSFAILTNVDIIVSGGGYSQTGIAISGQWSHTKLKDVSITTVPVSGCSNPDYGIAIEGGTKLTLDMEDVTIRAAGVGFWVNSAYQLPHVLNIKGSDIQGASGGIVLNNLGAAGTSANIRNSTVTGAPFSLSIASGINASAISTQFINPIDNSGTFKSLYCWDGNLVPLP